MSINPDFPVVVGQELPPRSEPGNGLPAPDTGQAGLLVGRFVIDQTHMIEEWDEGLELLTGRRASYMVGTRKQYETIYGYYRPVLADFLLDDDFEGARKVYGPANVWRSEQSGEWVAIGQCMDASGRSRPVLARTARIESSGHVIETLYSIERAADWASLVTDRYDGMRVLADFVPAGVALMQDCRILFVNQTFCSMFGYSSPGELVGRLSLDLLVEEQRHLHVQMVRGLNKETARGARYQWTGIDKNGRKIWFEGRPMPIEWNGRPAVLSFVLDITEYKQREEFMERESQELRVENVRLKSSIDYRTRLGNIIGKSRKMQDVYETILRTANSESGIIIYGETGTGKEMVAKALHALSSRSSGPFVPVNCGAIPEELFESEMFGYRKGAFTGAYTDKMGLLDQARGGTLFLDEIGELGSYCQAKLLRVLGAGEYLPVGDPRPRHTDFRLISATNRTLESLVRNGEFREDLFYRLHVIPIQLPPLRDRREDIPFLVEHLLYKLGTSQGMPSRNLARLLDYDWPGNVRELQNVLERYVALGHLDFLNSECDESAEISTGAVEKGSLRAALETYERQLILDTLKRCGWNRCRAAESLELPRKTLFRKMKKLGIEET